MQVLSLAWRNLWRNRRRTLTTLLTMVVGMTGVLLFGGYNRTMGESLETAFVHGLGHLQLQHRDFLQYGSANAAEYGIRDYRRIQRVIETDPVLAPMLAVVTPTLTMGGIVGYYETGASRTALVQGVEPQGQSRLLRWDAYHLSRGPAAPAPLAGTAPNAAVLGRGLATSLGLCVRGETLCRRTARPAAAALPENLDALVAGEARHGGGASEVELLTATASGAPNIGRLHAAGIEIQGARELDDVYIGLHLAEAQRLLYGDGPPRATALIVQLTDSRLLGAARQRLQQLIDGGLGTQPLAIRDMAELQPLYERIVNMFGGIFGFMSVLISFVALFTISNTMNVAVYERTHEIGTLRAIGLNRRGVQRLFLCEGVLLGVLGGLLGIAVSFVAAWLINLAGLTWWPPGVVKPSPILIRIWREPQLVAAAFACLILAALLSAWLPARRAARHEIATALRRA